MGKPAAPRPALVRHEQLIAPLLSLAYLERAAVHVRLGWLPKVGLTETKIALGQHQYVDAMTAAKLERSYHSMSRLLGRGAHGVPGELRAWMMSIDEQTSDLEVLRRIYLGVKPALAASYATLVAKADVVLDRHLLEVLEPALAQAEQQIEWAKQTLGTRKGSSAAVAKLLASGRGKPLPRAGWLWAPNDRVPNCVRSAPPSGGRATKLPHRAADGPGTKRATGRFLHSLAMSELATMELYARCCYEHAAMPEELHQDYSRVIWDEARHAAAALRAAQRTGISFAALAVDTSNYEANYEYPTCQRGSRYELLWRLLIQGTFLDSLFIEGMPLQAKKLRFSNFEEAAYIADVIAEDKVSHVQIALKWARYLCDGDQQRVLEERAKAHASRHQTMMQGHRRYVAEDPDRAIAETERLHAQRKAAMQRFPFSLKVHVNRTARRAAGFSTEEIEQMLSWGYFYS